MKFLSDILAKAGLVVDGVVTLNNVESAATDTDKFVVIDNGVVKFRTGQQLLSDIGALSAESDTLNSVTSRGNTTTNSISVNNLTLSGNLNTLNQFYGLATNYANGIFVGYDQFAVYLGYSMGTTPVHIGSNGSGNVLIRTTGDTILENGALVTSVIKGDPTSQSIIFKNIANQTAASFFMDGAVFRIKSSASYDAINIFSNGRVGILQTSDAGYTFDIAGSLRVQDYIVVPRDAAFGTRAFLYNTDGNALIRTVSNDQLSMVFTSFPGISINNVVVYGNYVVGGYPTGGSISTIAFTGVEPSGSGQGFAMNVAGQIRTQGTASAAAFAYTGNLLSDNASQNIRGFYFNPSGIVGPATVYAFESTAGKIKVSDLSGSGTRMVVADADGILTTQSLPSGANIYNTDGTLTGNRTVTMASNVLAFNGGQVVIGSTSANTLGILTLTGNSTQTKSIVLTSTWSYQTSFTMNNGNFSAEFNLGGSTKNTNEGGPGVLQVATYNASTGVTRYPVSFFGNGNVAFGGSGNSVLADTGEAVQVRGTAVVTSTLTANSFVKSGGTSSQFLKADGSVDSNTYLTGNQSISLSGDATGSGTTAITVTLVNSGVTAGTYNNVTVNAKGLVTAGSNVSYLTSYTETDTLASVTGRGATTSTAVTFSGGITVGGQGTGTGLIGNAGFTSNYTGISLNGTLSTSNYNILSSPTETTLYINRPSGAAIRFREANGSDQLVIASGGAATFSSSITSRDISILESGSGQLTIQRQNNGFGSVVNFRTGTTLNWYLGTRGLSNNNFYIVNEGLGGVSNLILDASTGAATFSSSIRAPQMYGTSYSTLTSGAGTGTAVFDTLSTTGAGAYEVVIVANPNAAGSGSYADWYTGILVIGTGFNNTSVVHYIDFIQQSPMPRTLFGSGGGDLTVTAVFNNSGTESEEATNGATYTIRFKISGYNTSNTGAGTTIYLKKIGT